MIMYRLSKYNPKISYSDEWTSITDVGDKRYNLTIDEYLYYEKLYIQSLMMLIEDNRNVHIEKFEKIPQRTESFFRKYSIDKNVINIYEKDYQSVIYQSLYGGRCKFQYSDIPSLVRTMLREEAWFVIVTDRYKIDVGYDFYIHIYTEKLLHLQSYNLPKGIFLEKL